jgi:hypothetical protein
MSYRLYSAEVEPSGPYGGLQKVAVEIQPSLHPAAHTGLVKELTERAEHDQNEPAAQMANITRHDEHGTLVVLTGPNHDKGLEQHQAVARFIGKLIDPCDVIGVVYPNQDQVA